MPKRSPISPTPRRSLSASDLGLPLPLQPGVPTGSDPKGGQGSRAKKFVSQIPDTDPVLEKTRLLLQDGFAGVILFGPPGTSKSWYARQISAHLVNENPDKVRFIQFHPSYQYEDFIEGFAPNKDGKFELIDKIFLDLCRIAEHDYPNEECVLVIDEFSRCDVARVFGEALTYLETGKRGQIFRLASGREVTIPANLVIVGTMNPWDRGVDELDAALERRFAKIALTPDTALLNKILSENGVEDVLRAKIVGFFNVVKNHSNPLARIGHAYFRGVKDETSLTRLWDHQLGFHFERAFRLDKPSLDMVRQHWRTVFAIQKAALATDGPNGTP